MTPAQILPSPVRIQAAPQNQAQAAAAKPVALRPLRLAYLTTEYPKVSHTFIRREIVELERRGHSVLRLAIRNSGGAVADEADRYEHSRTFHCLSQSPWSFVSALGGLKLRHPLKWIGAAGAAMKMSRASDRGLLRHMAYLAEAALLLRILRQHRIEHLHVHFGTNAAAVARLIHKLGGPPYSITIHGPGEFDAPIGFSLRDKLIEARFVIAISDYCAAQIKRWLPVEHWSKIHQVRCTVGEEFFAQARPIPPDSRTLLSIGRLTPQKGQIVLIDAVKLLRDQGVDVNVIFAGDGEMRGVLEQRIKEHDLGDHITITGWVDEKTVRRHLQSCRALVQPSFAEGLPVVIMEAMAMARPVISSAIAGVPELVRNHDNGWLVTPNSVEELASAIRRALETPVDTLNAMGKAAQQCVRQRHHTQSEVARLEELFERYRT